MRTAGLRTLASLGVALVCGLAPVSISSAAPEAAQQAKERTTKRELTGNLTAKTSYSLSLETGRTPGAGVIEETLIPVNPKTVKLERIKSLSEIQRGDKLRVECRLTFREDDQGEEHLIGTTATKITWLSRGTAETGGLRSVSGIAQ